MSAGVPVGIEHVTGASPERVVRAMASLVQHAAEQGEKEAIDVILVGVPGRAGDEYREAVTSAIVGVTGEHRWVSAPPREAVDGETLTDLREE